MHERTAAKARQYRGGTENVPLIVGFGKAAELASRRLKNFDAKVCPLRNKLETSILTKIANTEVNGHPNLRLVNTTNIRFFGVESEALLVLLDQAGICASKGSACLSNLNGPSHVIKAMKPDCSQDSDQVGVNFNCHNVIPLDAYNSSHFNQQTDFNEVTIWVRKLESTNGTWPKINDCSPSNFAARWPLPSNRSAPFSPKAISDVPSPRNLLVNAKRDIPDRI